MLLRGSIFLFFCFCLFVSFVRAQDYDHVHGEGEQCGFDALLKKNPEAFRHFQENMSRALLHKQTRERHLRETLGAEYDLLQDPVYTLPMVVHVLHRRGEAIGGETNLEKKFIDIMIEELNAYLSGSHPNRIIPPEFQSVDGGDMGIRFALARRDPADLPTDGIIRLPLPAGSRFFADLTLDAAAISPQWNTRRYVNLYLVPRENLTNGPEEIFGAANFPFSAHLHGLGRGVVNASSQGVFTTDGLRFDDGIILRSTLVAGGSPNAREAFPRTLVHEVGHYLGLFHPWSSGSALFEPIGLCDVDDGCEDTPRTSEPSRGSIRSGASCAAIGNCFKDNVLQKPMVQNYMDYVPDRCQHMFTVCQRERMRTVLESTTFRRTLWEDNDALMPVDDALLQIQNNIGFTSFGFRHDNCATSVDFEDIRIANYGANPISSIEVQFFIREGIRTADDMDYGTAHGAARTIDFSPALASQARSTLFEEDLGNDVSIPIPKDMYNGNVFLRIMSVNGVADTEDDYGSNTYDVQVARDRFQNGLPSLQFGVDSDGDDDINFAAVAAYDNAFSIETGSKGNKLLRIHRSLESAEDGHAIWLFLRVLI